MVSDLIRPEREPAMGCDAIPNATELDYQYGRPLDLWSGALWLGAALGALRKLAEAGDQDAATWVVRVPDEVKARWPGVFDEFPYEGEPADEHAARRGLGHG